MATFNIKNIYSNWAYLDTLINRFQIIFLQELWISTDEDNILTDKYAQNNMILQMRAAEECTRRKSGRPFGGIGWLINKNIETSIVFKSDRISTLKISKSQVKLLIIGVYLPTNGTDQLDHLLNELAEIETIVETHSDHEIIIIGDFNCDIKRLNKHDKQLVATLNRLDMQCVDHTFEQEIDYTFQGRGVSWIDHIITKKNCGLKINDVRILTENDGGNDRFEYLNKSDHTPVYIDFELALNNQSPRSTKNDKKIGTAKPNWEDLSFKTDYNKKLNEIIITSNLIERTYNIKYETKEELDKIINELYDNINKSIEWAMKNKKSKTKQGEKYKKSNSWWDGELSRIRKKMRYYIIKKNKKNKTEKYKNKIKKWKYLFRKKQRQKIAELRDKTTKKLIKLDKLNNKKLWSEIGKIINHNKKPDIDVNAATNVFKDLFNCHHNNSNENKMKNETIRKRNEERIKQKSTEREHKVEIRVIKDIIKNLSNGKSSGDSNVTNESLKYCEVERVLVTIQAILQRIVDFGYIPKKFNVGVITPIIKDEHGDLKSVNNIRPITVSDVLANIFEKYMLNHIEDAHNEPEQQFGFKARSSCQHALFAFRETIKHYRSRRKAVYVGLIDASKAFDKINREILFEKLYKIIDKKLWVALYEYYNNSYGYVTLNGLRGDIFRTTIGVKQGGPLSPKLFSIYVEDLIYELLECNDICQINGIKCGVIMYADDLTILCESPKGLNICLDICDKYGKKCDIKYNAEKTQYMIFGTKSQRDKTHKIIMDKKQLSRAKVSKLLGREFSDDLKDDEHFRIRNNKTMKSYYCLEKVGINNKYSNIKYKTKLFKVFCRPILHYGAENMRMTAKMRTRMKRCEAGIIKRALGLPKRLKNTDLFNACKIDTTNDYINKSKLKLMIRILSNKLTRQIIDCQIEIYKNNKNKLAKDSYILEIIEICEESIENTEDLWRKCLNKIKNIEVSIKQARKSKNISELNDYLNRPTKENIEKIKEILRPNSLK